MTRPALLAVSLAVAVLAGCKDSQTDDKPQEESPPAIVFTQERSTSEDVIYLRNDEKRRGQVMVTSLSVSTPYGELSIAADRCARVAFFEDDEDKEAGIEVIITVNGNRITGTNAEPTIRFKDGGSGDETEVEKKDIWFIALREDSDELDFLDAKEPPDQFIMANGDLLTGHAAEYDLVIRTDSGEIPIPFAEIASVRCPSDPEVKGDKDEETGSGTDESMATVPKEVTAVVTKRNKDVVRGTLATEKLTLNLEVGVTIEAIGKDKFARIHTGDGEAVTNSIGMEMVLIPAGEFTMGSPPDEEQRDDDETQRQVTLTRGFHMSATEVTQGEWVSIMGEYPSEFKGGLLPVENISWEEAVKFCEELSKLENREYRLPTEAEWEYACRAGTTTAFNTGDTISTDQANYDGDGTYGGGSKGVNLEQTAPVGSYQPNAWGLYDMHGNVWEWCHDLHGTYSAEAVVDPTGATPGTSRVPRTSHVLRGGGWSGGPEFCRSAYRAWSSPTSSDRYLGFRIVLNEN